MTVVARRWWALLALPAWPAWFLLAALAAMPARAQGVLITLIDGEATLIDGARRVAAAPGLPLSPGTIVETGAGTAVLRLETPERAAVDLGPATRAMLLPPGFAVRNGRAPLLYLLSGWAKLSSPEKNPIGGLVTPAIELLPFVGSAVVSAGKAGTSVFAESGALELAERTGARRTPLRGGALFGGGAVEAKPPAEWLARVPRAFRDTLPRRGAAFAERTVAATVLPGPSYAQLADWLAAEPALRREFPRRFEALAQEPAFRRELQQRLGAHPEWARVLNPPEPKKP